MATKNYTAGKSAWVLVATGGCLIEVPRVCGRVNVTTATSLQNINDDAFHTIADTDCRTFSYSQSHGVYVRANTTNKDDAIKVVVTADNLA